MPELSEPEVLRHYLHLSQETLGMMGISLFGTCTMKYNPRVNEVVTKSPDITEMHPYQDPDTLQGVLEIVHRFDLDPARAVGYGSVRVPAGRWRRRGVPSRHTHACVSRFSQVTSVSATEVITTAQAHPCNPATAAAAGFDVITLPLEDERGTRPSMHCEPPSPTEPPPSW